MSDLLSTQVEVPRTGIELFPRLYDKHYTFFIIVNFKIEHEDFICRTFILQKKKSMRWPCQWKREN